MSRRKYPYLSDVDWRPVKGAQAPGVACSCGATWEIDARLCILTWQVSWFRGDDDVEYLCEKCARAKGHKPPPTQEEKFRYRLETWRRERAGIRKAIAKQEALLAEIPNKIKGLRKQVERLENCILAAEKGKQ